MCWAYCQACELGRGQVYCGNIQRADVYGLTGGCEQSGGCDTGKRNGGPKLADDGNEMKQNNEMK